MTHLFGLRNGQAEKAKWNEIVHVEGPGARRIGLPSSANRLTDQLPVGRQLQNSNTTPTRPSPKATIIVIRRNAQIR